MKIKSERSMGGVRLADMNPPDDVFIFESKPYVRVECGAKMDPNGGGRWNFVCFCLANRMLVDIPSESIVEPKPNAFISMGD